MPQLAPWADFFGADIAELDIAAALAVPSIS
jgi:hypothetical protein